MPTPPGRPTARRSPSTGSCSCFRASTSRTAATSSPSGPTAPGRSGRSPTTLLIPSAPSPVGRRDRRPTTTETDDSRRFRAMKRTLSILCLASVALVALVTGSGTAVADPGIGVCDVAGAACVMSGLDNPRGLAFGPQGALYVAEAGRGDIGEGDGPCATAPGGTQVCYGATGAVSRLWRGEQTRVATGLPSFATAAGRAQGPNDIALLG